MPDFSVYVILENNTGESLTNGTAEATSGYWQWNDFHSSIAAHSSSALSTTAWLSGTEGTFSYKIRDTEHIRSRITADVTDPYSGDNKISITDPEPAALYTCSFRTYVGDGDWKDNDVEQKGHPVTVEYTIQYQRRSFRFEVNELSKPSRPGSSAS